MSGTPAGAILEADGLSVRRGARLVVDSVSVSYTHLTLPTILRV